MTTEYRRIVALGSSYAAGPGVEPTIDKAAMRSGRNYAHLVAETLHAELVDATVSGATTETILTTPQKVGGRTFTPQIESVGPDADLVTVTAGGNDLGYIGGALFSGVVGTLRRRLPTRPISWVLGAILPNVSVPGPEKIETATAGLARIAEEAQQRAPKARVVLVDYLPLFSNDAESDESLPFQREQIGRLRETRELLSEAYCEASRRSGADLLPSSVYADGHGVGADEPWIYGLRPRQLGSSFHPTAAGMEAVAAHLLEFLASPAAQRA